jgi:hypothetical protein
MQHVLVNSEKTYGMSASRRYIHDNLSSCQRTLVQLKLVSVCPVSWYLTLGNAVSGIVKKLNISAVMCS